MQTGEKKSCFAGCFAQTILKEQQGKGGQRAAGVVVHPTDNPSLAIEVSSQYTFASCGSLHNPALLLRSGITCRGNVGKHLHLHCGAASVAGFPKKVGAWSFWTC